MVSIKGSSCSQIKATFREGVGFMVKYFENLLNRKADKIRLLLSMHKAKLKVQLVSKC